MWCNMDNIYNATKEQKHKWTTEALEIIGFEEMPSPGIYAKKHEDDKKILVDLNEKQPTAIFMIAGKRVAEDDEHGTLLIINQIIVDAEIGKMPSQTTADMQYNKEDKAKPQAKEESAHAKETPPQANESPPAHVPESNESEVFDPPESGGQEERAPAVPARQHQPPAEIVHSTAPPAPFVPQGTMIKNIVPGLKEIGKIKIGRKGEMRKSKKGNDFRPPEKFDHFEIVTLHKDENGDFMPDAAIMGLIGEDAKEIDVSLLYNDPSLNLFTRYNQYKGGRCMCSGDGEQAVQADGTKIQCDPDTCTVFKTKHCKANGILSVILKDSPRLGGVYKFRTTSFNSIRSIMSSMFFLQSLTGGILANIPLKMTVSPMSVNPVGSPTAQTIYVVNLEYPGNVDDLRKHTLQLMTEQAGMHNKMIELEAQARAAISVPETKEEIEDIESEWYPDNATDVPA